ncbi:SDR family oxidoreductase [Haloarcula halophila]|uniref:SDR family oxidoreductase n=1 Tax=Haloarcula TaxID=2237 RepID=UPI0023E41190|nr:SDR family oxidoreductase [Halomicroarcula sp. DFY41]
MKILVIGGSGLVGWFFVESCVAEGLDVAYTVHTNAVEHKGVPVYTVDIRNAEETASVIKDIDPDIVFHTAGISDADQCERYPDQSHEINVDGTTYIADACEVQGIPLVFVSTSMVFDGSEDSYTEDDTRSPKTTYGEQKVACEDIVRDTTVDSTVIRIDQPYCWPMEWHTGTFVSWTYTHLLAENPFPVFTDWYNTPVFMDDLTDAVMTVIRTGSTGTYHIVGSEFVSRYEWARQIANALGYDPDLIRRGHSEGAGLPADRPAVNLSNERIKGSLNVEFRSISEALSVLASRRQIKNLSTEGHMHR